jgi:hypothetical protein
LASVREEFRDLFRLRSAPQPPEPDREEEAREQAERAELLRDARVFFSTTTYKKVRDEIEAEIKAAAPDPRQGSDVAACCAFQQQGLRRALEILDRRIILAQEVLNDAV